MDDHPASLNLETIPHRLFFSALPSGALEFSCFVRFPAQNASRTVTWSITETTMTTASLTGRRAITNAEQTTGRIFIAAALPAHWGDSQLRVEV